MVFVDMTRRPVQSWRRTVCKRLLLLLLVMRSIIRTTGPLNTTTTDRLCRYVEASSHRHARHDETVPSVRYDTRCYFNVRSKADTSQLNLPHVRFGGVNWIPGNSRLSPTENLKSERIRINRPIHTDTPDTTQTGLSCRVWRAVWIRHNCQRWPTASMQKRFYVFFFKIFVTFLTFFPTFKKVFETFFIVVPSVLWHSCLGVRKGIRLYKLSGEVLVRDADWRGSFVYIIYHNIACKCVNRRGTRWEWAELTQSLYRSS